MKRTLFLWLCFFIAPYTAVAVANVTEYQLDNGLKVFVKEDHRAPVVASQVWYKVGSSYEYGGITGVSHLLEHMMFRGSKNYGPGEYSTIIAENGGRDNAFTSYDYTAYYQLMSADKLEISFQLEADRMRYLNMSDDIFKKEQQVVLEERRWRVNDDSQSQTYERFLAAAHVKNPYHHPVIGWMEDIAGLTLQNAEDWYTTWYTPNNAVLVVVGDVKPNEVLALAKKHFGPLKPQTITPVKPQNALEPLGKRELNVQIPAKLPLLLMGYQAPVINTSKEAYEPYALALLAGILSGGDSARFEKKLVREMQIASQIGAGYSPFRRLDTLFMISAIPSNFSDVTKLQEAIQKEILQVKKVAIAAEELAKVKAQVIAQDVYKKDSLLAQANQIGSLEAVGIAWKVGEDFAKNIEKITGEQVQQVARKYLVDTRLTLATLTPLPMSNKAEKRKASAKGASYVDKK